MTYRLHPAAADEHIEHIAFYEAQRQGLGRRYDEAFEAAMRAICDVAAPSTRAAIQTCKATPGQQLFISWASA